MTMPSPCASCNVALSNDFSEDWPDKHDALRNAIRILRPCVISSNRCECRSCVVVSFSLPAVGEEVAELVQGVLNVLGVFNGPWHDQMLRNPIAQSESRRRPADFTYSKTGSNDLQSASYMDQENHLRRRE